MRRPIRARPSRCDNSGGGGIMLHSQFHVMLPSPPVSQMRRWLGRWDGLGQCRNLVIQIYCGLSIENTAPTKLCKVFDADGSKQTAWQLPAARTFQLRGEQTQTVADCT